jgi:Fe-S-cluster containining protein
MNQTESFAHLDRLHTAASNAFNKAIAKHGGCACGDNCPACCREPVYASRLEAERIVALLDNEQKEILKEKLTFWLAVFYGSGQHTEERPKVFTYVPAMPPCPLLKGTRCGVYEHRPLECRAHFAMKHRSFCEDIEKRREQKHAVFNDKLLHQIMCENLRIEGEMVIDHLCIHLAEILIGPQPETEARHQIIAEFVEEGAKCAD